MAMLAAKSKQFASAGRRAVQVAAAFRSRSRLTAMSEGRQILSRWADLLSETLAVTRAGKRSE